jgi:molybdate transport system ATP-binding protein
MTVIVRVEGARCRIGSKAMLRADHFEIQCGQHWCLFGPNGAGKSTLARLLAGQMRESRLYVTFAAGFDPARDVHLVSFEEQQRLWQRDDRFDISEYSESAQDQGTQVETLVRSSRHGAQDEAVLESLLSALDLLPLRAQGIRFLSSGQIRKALLARALYAWREGVPQLILLDDPLESIDKASRRRIEATIARFLHDGNASVQLCRRLVDLPDSATHLALMQNLELREQGGIDQIRQLPAFQALQSTTTAEVDLPASSAAMTDELVPGAPLIELRKVNANYGDKRILSDINWRMEAHHHVLIEGPNGCGKSTLLSLIDGENHKGYGQDLTLFGRRKGSGEAVWEIKRRFGLVSNELHNKYVKGWRVLEVIVSGFFDSVGLYDDSGSSQKSVARDWLQAFAIAELEAKYYHELSFGQQRLVLLARAMVKNPAILILDEPCVGLDDRHRAMILQTLDKIAARTMTRLIYVSHVEDEQPGCINQWLRFSPAPEGGHTLVTAPVSPRI